MHAVPQLCVETTHYSRLKHGNPLELLVEESPAKEALEQISLHEAVVPHCAYQLDDWSDVSQKAEL